MTDTPTPKNDASRVSMLWATIEHADELAACHKTLFDPPWDKESFEQFLSHPGSTALIARTGNPQETVGFIIAQLAADEAEILTFGVRKDWQRLGLGKRLVDGLKRAAQRGEAKKLFLEVADDNLPALVLYSRIGFKDVGRRAAYYKRADGTTADALVLSLAL